MLPRTLIPPEPATVILIHGALVKGLELEGLAWRLRRLGYRVRIYRWSSMWGGKEENIQRLGHYLASVPGATLHLVAHSMGGVLAREVLQRQPTLTPGRFIAIGSPFLDCWIARRILRYRGGRYAVGRTVRDHVEQVSPRPWTGGRELGILAGTFSFGVGRNFRTMPKPNDGVILWRETRLPGAADHVTFPINHFGLLLSHRCYRQIAHFLAQGRFAAAGPGLRSGLVLQQEIEMAEPEPLTRFDKAVVDPHAIDKNPISGTEVF